MDTHELETSDMYSYRPLDKQSKEIRLLKLSPSASPTAPIYCAIDHVALVALPPPNYETISYVWGDPKIRSKIMVNGAVLDVPASAEEVLRRMRFVDKERTLWIDAVCINQNDVVERGHQVALMALIYSRTILNLIWLGWDTIECVSEACKAMDIVLRDARDETKDFNDLADRSEDLALGRDRYGNILKPFGQEIDIEPLLQLFAKPWFHRLWVIQEAALAPKSICCHGSCEIPLLDVLRTACWLRCKSLHLPIPSYKNVGLRNAAYIWRYTDSEHGPFSTRMLGDDSPSVSTVLLRDLILETRGPNAYDPRDHVYGILGLYQKYRAGDLPRDLTPDYGKTLQDVLRDSTRFAVEEAEDLGHFYNISHRSQQSINDAEIPTWTLRADQPWTFRTDPATFSRIFCGCGTRQSHRTHPPIALDCKDQLLYTSGIQVAHLKYVSEPITDQTTRSQDFDILNSFEEAQTQDSGGLDLSAIGATLAAGIDFQRHEISPKAAAEGYVAWRNHIKTKQEYPPGLHGIRHKEFTPHDYTMAQFDHAYRNASFFRSLFVTKDGCPGVGPKMMLESDIVAVLWGCQWPVILRPLPQKGQYNMVGTAYVHGIMFGEAVDAFEAAGEAEQIFWLR